LAPSDHALSAAIHHVAADGWSMAILAGEVSRLYAAALAGRAPDLPPLPVQYADYAIWQARCLRGLRGEALDGQLAWWKATLAGAPTPLALPVDRPRRGASSRGGSRHFHLPPALAAGVAALARSADATRFMVLLAAFAALLQRVTGEDDLTI